MDTLVRVVFVVLPVSVPSRKTLAPVGVELTWMLPVVGDGGVGEVDELQDATAKAIAEAAKRPKKPFTKTLLFPMFFPLLCGIDSLF